MQWSFASSSQEPACDVPVQLADDDLKPSAGQAPEAPVHSSATSHWPTAPRHCVVDGLNWQELVQQAPPSHCSPVSTTPLPQTVLHLPALPASKMALISVAVSARLKNVGSSMTPLN